MGWDSYDADTAEARIPVWYKNYLDGMTKWFQRENGLDENSIENEDSLLIPNEVALKHLQQWINWSENPTVL